MVLEKIKSLAKQYQAENVLIRRHLHAHPELSYQEFETSKYVQAQLTAIGIPFTVIATTGVLGMIEGKNPSKKIIALRADMDALPILEENKIDYKSTKEGIMHACGHDVHTTILLGAAKILWSLRSEWEGTIKLLFQPGEEKNPGGASYMIRDGALTNPVPQGIIGLHVHPGLNHGKLSFRKGREKIGIDLANSIQKILDSYKSGIYVTSVTVQNVQPPEQVQAAFDDAVKAGQDQERLKSEGQAYANDIIPRAKGTAARLIQEAEGYKARVAATAEGDATRFKQVLVEYSKAPQVTRDRMYIDSMREMYNNVTKILVDTTKSNSLLYLPLDKIVAQVSAESAQAASSQVNQSSAPTPTGSVTVGGATGMNNPAPTSSSSSAPVVNNSNDRSLDKRDGFRSRDRDPR